MPRPPSAPRMRKQSGCCIRRAVTTDTCTGSSASSRTCTPASHSRRSGTNTSSATHSPTSPARPTSTPSSPSGATHLSTRPRRTPSSRRWSTRAPSPSLSYTRCPTPHSLAREEHDRAAQAFLSRYAATLRDLIQAKLDSLTSAYLAHSDQYHDASHTLSLSHHSEHVDYALWVHGSAKHGRVKRIDWPDVGITVELPVALQQSRIAIRAVRTTYDHVSDREDDDDVSAPPPYHESTEDREQRERARDVRRALRPPHHFTSVGGLISIEQLALPPPPKQAKGWAMRELAHTNSPLQPIPYPNEDAVVVPSSSPQSVPATAAAPSSTTAAVATNAPLRLSFHIPPSIYLPQETPHFGWYDTATHAWRQDGIVLLSFDPATRLTHLSLSTLRPIALIQPRALDFPYRQWYLHTNGGHCELLLKGSRYDTTILIAHGQCRLLHPTHPLLASVNDHSFPPGRLLLRMQQLGLNVLPTDEDGDYCRKPRKRDELVEALHGHISGVVAVFDVGGMEMNGGRGEGVAMLRVRLSKGSLALQDSVEKRKRWEEKRAEDAWWKAEQEEEDERRRAAEESKEPSPPPASTDADSDDDADPHADEKRADAERKAAETKKVEADRKTVDTADRPPPTPSSYDPSETAEQRRERAHSWHTVLVTLTDIDGTEVSSASPSLAPLAFGTIPEHVPGGHHLLRFTLVKGSTNGQVDVTPLAGQGVHVSLRRCVYEWWKGLVRQDECGWDLASALDMSEEAGQLRFLPVDEQRLYHQQTVRKTLNLTNPFRFF